MSTLEWTESFIVVLQERISGMLCVEFPFGWISKNLNRLVKCVRVALRRCDTATKVQKSAVEPFLQLVLDFLCYLDGVIDLIAAAVTEDKTNELDEFLNFGIEMVWMEAKPKLEYDIRFLFYIASVLGFIVNEGENEEQEEEDEGKGEGGGGGGGVEEEEQEVVGIDEEEQRVVKRLCEGQVSLEVVSVMGPEGIGKTTLAKKVYSNAMVVRQFPCRLWVTLKQDEVTISSTKKIGKQAMVWSKKARKVWPLDEFMKKLCPYLKYKKYLIILDDLQTPKEWDMLQKVLPDNSNRSRILITTRNNGSIYMDKGSNWHYHEKMLLSEEDGWELFEAILDYHVPIEVKHIGKEIVSKCMGFPSRILTFGHFLSQKAANKEHWSMMLNQMSSEQVNLYFSLKTTADSLPPKLKQCLFYFGLFRQDYDIPARRLIVLWVAEGLVEEENGEKEQPEFLAEKMLMKLIRHNLIQVAKWKRNGKVKTCRLNYFLRENLLSQAKEADFLQCSRKSPSQDKATRLSDLYDSEDHFFSHIHGSATLKKSYLQRHYNDLCTFLSFDYREGPEPGEDIGNFLRRGLTKGCFKKLRVMDFEGVFQPKLPESLGKLIELRYLGLRSTYIENLPSSIGKLTKLQTLDLKTTKISTLPTSLWKMKELRHLYLSESYRCRFLPPPFENSLINLQTLWGAFVDEETPIRDGLDRLINLRKLGLVYQLTTMQQGELAVWITNLEHIEYLRLRSIDKTFVQTSKLYIRPFPILNKLSSVYLHGKLENAAVVRYLPHCLTEITLSSSGLSIDPMEMLEKLPNLRILNLYSGSFAGKGMLCSSGGFPVLMTLNIWLLEDFEEWVVEQGALLALRELEIRCCNKLKMIPDGIKHLRNLRKLKLTKMPLEFKLRVTKNQGEDWSNVVHIPSIIIKD